MHHIDCQRLFECYTKKLFQTVTIMLDLTFEDYSSIMESFSKLGSFYLFETDGQEIPCLNFYSLTF
jgi:hypothetical protein